jgi:hypothetical protein
MQLKRKTKNNMQYKDYQDYFEDLATKHKKIQHSNEKKRFCDVDPEEIITGLRSKIDFKNFCLVLESFDMETQDRYADNPRGLYSGAFWIIKHCTPGNLAIKKETLNESLDIVYSILSRIKKDKEQLPKIKTIPHFVDVNSFSINKIGPVHDNCYGFNFNNSLSGTLKYNKDDWNEI